MEPARCLHSDPVSNRHLSGGDRGPGVPHQPHHHQGDEGAQDCQGAQASQDGKGYKISSRHCHASFTSGQYDFPGFNYKTPPTPLSEVLPSLSL